MSTHTRRDAALTQTKALPAAAANNDSDSIDLGAATVGAIGDSIEVSISLPALANLVEAKTVTVTLQDSANDSSFAAIAGLSTLVVTGATGGGAAAASRIVRLPSYTRRYIRVNTAVLTGGGDNTASSVTLSVLT